MEIGQSRTTNMILRMLGEDTCKNIDDYVREVSSRNFVSFYSEDDVKKVFGDKFYEFLLSLSEEELMDLIKYQRAYEASARVFTTSSEILEVLVNLAK